MSGGGFDYSEFKKLNEGVKQLDKNSVKFIENFLFEMAERALTKTKKRTPVGVGDLRGAWYRSGIARRGNDFMINLINPKLYASFVEYGHFQQVGRFIPGYWSGDKFVYVKDYETGMVLKNPWVEGRFMLTISVQEIEREIPARLSAAWAKYATGMLKG